MENPLQKPGRSGLVAGKVCRASTARVHASDIDYFAYSINTVSSWDTLTSISRRRRRRTDSPLAAVPTASSSKLIQSKDKSHDDGKGCADGLKGCPEQSAVHVVVPLGLGSMLW